MKRCLVYILIMLSLCNVAHSFQNEPSGFRGIKWETDIKALPDMICAEGQGDTEFCTRQNDEMAIGAAELDRIEYGFHGGKFFTVLIKYHSSSNYFNLKDAFVRQYGGCYQPNLTKEECYWNGSNVDIVLRHNSVIHIGSVTYTYKPIADQK